VYKHWCEECLAVRSLTQSELKALVRLLDEEERFAALIEERLLEAGEAALPYLHEALHSPNPLVRTRAGQLVARLRFQQLEEELARFASLDDREMDLETGVFLVARYGYPDLDTTWYSQELDRIAGAISRELHDGMYMEDIIDCINERLFSIEGFQADHQRYYDPENSYINRVIDRRVGIPITLSVIYLLIAKRLNLPISGVAFPGHFLVRYDGPYETLWIDPFNDGAILSREDCEELLRAMGYPVVDEYLAPCTTRQIVARMFNNLAQALLRQGQEARAHEVKKLVLILLT